MARVLIVGCGCRGQALARELRARGHAVRGTTRSAERRGAAIAAAGAEVWVGDPDRIASIHYALDGVTVVCWLLGSADGTADRVAALHGPRLRMLLERTIDTTVRGVVYEAAGGVDPALLDAGAATVQQACAYSEIPYALLRADPAAGPGGHAAWLDAALACVEGLLAFRRARSGA